MLLPEQQSGDFSGLAIAKRPPWLATLANCGTIYDRKAWITAAGDSAFLDANPMVALFPVPRGRSRGLSSGRYLIQAAAECVPRQ